MRIKGITSDAKMRNFWVKINLFQGEGNERAAGESRAVEGVTSYSTVTLLARFLG